MTILSPAEEHVRRQEAAKAAAEAEGGSTPPEAPNAAEAASDGPSREATAVRKFAIVGYTPTAIEALPLLDDPEWEVWGMNNLHLQSWVAPHVSKFGAWFDLHPTQLIERDAAHAAWLAAGANGVPVWTWEAVEKWPTTRAYPRDLILQRFGRYFTNTVSWQLALAILRIMDTTDGPRAPEGSHIAVFGIDMATGSEYALQRPSVEYYLGVAAGAGIQITLPERSDLLKTATLYGEPDNGLRAKLEERREQLTLQIAEHEKKVGEHTAAVHGLRGALEQVNYIAGVWTQPNIDRNAPQNQPSQDGAAPT